MRRPLTAFALLTLLLPLAACGQSTDDGPGKSDGPAWARSTDPVPTDGLVWADAASGMVHLGDGSTLDAGTALASYVVAGDGAYALAKDSSSLLLVTPDGVDRTGAEVDDVKASPDGRYLAYVDTGSGKDSGDGTRLRQTVVLDLREGTEVLRSSRGMGDPDDDLRDLYEDSEPGLLGITDKTAWFKTAGSDDVLAVDLGSGKVTEDDDGQIYDTTRPWFSDTYRDDLDTGPWNADHTWAIESTRLPKTSFVSEDEKRVAPRPPTPAWTLARWLDTDTAIGFALAAPAVGGNTKLADATLMTCTVPDGKCTLVPDTEGPLGSVLLPTTNLL